MRKRKKNNNGVFYVAISLIAVVIVGSIGILQVGKAQIEKSELADLANFADSVNGNVEAFKFGLNYLAVKLGLENEMLGGTIGSDVYHDVTFHGDVLLERPDAPITIPIQFRPTTTDVGTAQAGVGGRLKNNGDPMLCLNPYVYLWDDAASFTWSFGVGTTTNKDGNFLTATTSRTLYSTNRVGTTTEDVGWDLWGGTHTTTPGIIYGAHYTVYAAGGGGYSSSTPWLWDTNDLVVIDIAYDGATSTESFTTDGRTDLTPGAVYIDCFNMY